MVGLLFRQPELAGRNFFFYLSKAFCAKTLGGPHVIFSGEIRVLIAIPVSVTRPLRDEGFDDTRVR